MTAPSSVAEIAGTHRRIAIDSNVLIYLLDGRIPEADIAAEVVDSLAAGTVDAVLASLGFAEILVGPASLNDPALVERIADEIDSIEGLRIVPLSADIAVEAARMRGTERCGLADAIHLATARTSGATAFVTNDRRLRSVPRLAVIQLGDLVAGRAGMPPPRNGPAGDAPTAPLAATRTSRR